MVLLKKKSTLTLTLPFFSLPFRTANLSFYSFLNRHQWIRLVFHEKRAYFRIAVRQAKILDAGSAINRGPFEAKLIESGLKKTTAERVCDLVWFREVGSAIHSDEESKIKIKSDETMQGKGQGSASLPPMDRKAGLSPSANEDRGKQQYLVTTPVQK